MSSYSVAVIMSVYRSDDYEQFLTAVNSILNQTLPVDLFIYQDGSVSSEIFSELCQLNELQNVYVTFSEENKGLAFGLNTLIDITVGRGYDFIARMDSDDISHAARIKKQVDFLTENPEISVLGTSCKEFGASFAIDEKHLPTSHEELLDFSITRCPLIHPSVMFRRSVFDNGKRYPLNTRLTEDMGLWVDLLCSGYKFANLNEILIDYRLVESTIIRRRGVKKSISEVSVRCRFMFKLGRFSFKNSIGILAKGVFHLLPIPLIKFAYKKMR